MLKNTFTVTMHGESGDLDVYDLAGGHEDRSLSSWDNAIKAAWGRLGHTGGWWKAATVRQIGPYGMTVRLSAEDKEAADKAFAGWVREQERIAAETGHREPLFDDESE